MTAPFEIVLTAVVVAVACALPGPLLLLRRQALMSDAISHVVLLGIVVAFLFVGQLDSPWLAIGAALSGVLTVGLVELLGRTRLLREDAAIGLVFPALFSVGVILGSIYTREVHLDADAVMLGHLELAVFDHWIWRGRDLGPWPLWQMLAVLLLNAAFLLLFDKELRLATFDPALAAALGFRPGWLHYGLMTLVSITAVTAFSAVGPALVVALMIVPAAAAYLLTDRLTSLVFTSVVLAALGAVLGIELAHRVNGSYAGSMAVALGAIFAVVYLFAPTRGWLAGVLRRRRQRRDFRVTMLAVHLRHHERTESEAEEARVDGLSMHLGWPASLARRVVARATQEGMVRQEGRLLKLTDAGRQRAVDVLGGSS